MEPLFQNSHVIKLKDRDFVMDPNGTGPGSVKLRNKDFVGKDGYIMAFWQSCPHCRTKEDFWDYLATQFNRNPQYQRENFLIAILDIEDPEAQQVVRQLEITGVPRFFHVISDPNNPRLAKIVDYQGDLSIEGLLGAVCNHSAKGNLCGFDSKRLRPPAIGH